MITLASEAARRAGEVLMASYGSSQHRVEQKGQADFVSEVDRAAEAVVLETLQRECPDHGFVLEESGRLDAERDFVWIVDPLDGTTNYLHRFPFFSVSVGLAHKGEVVLGVVYDPLRNELFSAEKGDGLRLNGLELRVSRNDADRALISTGFPFRVRQHLDSYLGLFKDVFEAVSGVRRAGSAALDLAYVACGRVDGFFELGLSPWDVAAGSLLVQEAGGQVSDFHGGTAFLWEGDIVASNGRLHETLVERTRRHYPVRPTR